MKYTLITLFFTLSMGLFNVSFACDIFQYPFCQTLLMNEEDVVLKAKVLSYMDEGIKLEVMEVYRGEEQRSVVNVWNGTDFDCNGPFEMDAAMLGALEDTIIAILPRIETIENDWEVIGDYRSSLFWFYTHSVVQDGDSLRGFFYDWPYQYAIHVSEFEEFGEDCGLTTSLPKPILSPEITIYPIPATNELNIDITGPNTNGIHLRIFNVKGQLVKQENFFGIRNQLEISDLRTGVYFAEISVNGIFKRQKIMINTSPH